jgi:hypothetical protein
MGRSTEYALTDADKQVTRDHDDEYEITSIIQDYSGLCCNFRSYFDTP